MSHHLNRSYGNRLFKYYPQPCGRGILSLSFPFAFANTFYINAVSYHAPTIIKQLSEMISKGISDLFCNKEGCGKIKSIYETALKESGHFSSMSSNNSNTQNSRRNRNKGYMIQPTI